MKTYGGATEWKRLMACGFTYKGRVLTWRVVREDFHRVSPSLAISMTRVPSMLLPVLAMAPIACGCALMKLKQAEVLLDER